MAEIVDADEAYRTSHTGIQHLRRLWTTLADGGR